MSMQQHYSAGQLDTMLRETDSAQQLAELDQHVRSQCDPETRSAWEQVLQPMADEVGLDLDDIEL